MSLIKFTRNFTDHSNDTGYQFEFFCDHCGNGYRSSFQPSAMGMAGGFLRAAGSFFGGKLSQAAGASQYLKDSLRGPAQDKAFSAAVAEATPHFKQCTRCGKWVCPENCWNHKRNMCDGCAPDLEKESASIQSQVAVEQARQKAQSVDQIRGQVDVVGVEVAATGAAVCPHCNADTKGSKKFCPECGKALHTSSNCAKCNAKIEANAKFCGECGAKVE